MLITELKKGPLGFRHLTENETAADTLKVSLNEEGPDIEHN